MYFLIVAFISKFHFDTVDWMSGRISSHFDDEWRLRLPL